MLKKNAWIAALFLALVMVFAGCVEEPYEAPDTYYSVPLGDFNTVAGQPDNQKGWATFGHNEADVQREDLVVSDFIAARFLVLELGAKPAGGLDLVWGTPGAKGGWHSSQILSNVGNVVDGKGTTLSDSNVLTINLTRGLVDYATYKTIDDYVRLVVCYYTGGIAALDIQKAYLLISAGGSVPVSFNLDGGKYLGNSSIDDIWVQQGLALGTQFPGIHPLKSGLVFDGWYWRDPAVTKETDAGAWVLYDSTTTITKAVTLKARYTAGTPANYLVTFGANGGSPLSKTSGYVVRGQPVNSLGNNLPTTALSGYWFGGWALTDEDGDIIYTLDEDGDPTDIPEALYGASTPVTGDINLAAHWIALNIPSTLAVASINKYHLYAGTFPSITVVPGALSEARAGRGNINDADTLKALRDQLLNKTVTQYPQYSRLVVYAVHPAGDGDIPSTIATIGGVTISTPAGSVKGTPLFGSVVYSQIPNFNNLGAISVIPSGGFIIQKIALFEPDSDFDPTCHCDGLFMLDCTCLGGCEESDTCANGVVGTPYATDAAFNNANLGLVAAGGWGGATNQLYIRKLPSDVYNGGIFIHGRSQDWTGVDLKFATSAGAGSIVIDPAKYYRVTARGVTLAGATVQLNQRLNASPWGVAKGTTTVGNDGGGLGNFEVVGDSILGADMIKGYDYNATVKIDGLRILTTGLQDFVVSYVRVEELASNGGNPVAGDPLYVFPEGYVQPSFTPVTGISGLPNSGFVGTPVSFASAVGIPSSATNKTVTKIEIKAASGSWATPADVTAITAPWTHTFAATGTYNIRVTVANGLTATTDYVSPGTATITITAPDYVVDLTGLTVTNATNLAAKNDGFAIVLPALPAGFNIEDYAYISIRGTFADYDGAAVEPNWGSGGIKIGPDTNSTETDWDTPANVYAAIDNLGMTASDWQGAGYRNASIGYLIDHSSNELSELTGGSVWAIWLFKADSETSGTGVATITLTSITFHN